jgi:hypothetical protein
MNDTAAHYVDRVLPWVPYRQWVVTFSPPVRWHLGDDPALASRAITAVVRTLSRWQRARARRLGVKLPRNTSRTSGAIAFIERFDSALRSNFHLHMVAPDGVFVREAARPDARPRFVPIDPPSDEVVRALLDRSIARVTELVGPRLRAQVDALDTRCAPGGRSAS